MVAKNGKLEQGAAKVLAAALIVGLTACGGSSSEATIGGTIKGLSNGLSLTLQNNASDNFTISGNGSASFSFAFATPLAADAGYSVSVLTQPLGQTCSVTAPSGSVDSSGSDVSTVVVTCATTSSVVGTVSGLNSGVAVTLSSNGSSLLLGNGPFAFAGVLVTGSTYSVSIVQQPVGQTCTVYNSSGTVVANQSSAVTVTCI